MDTDLTVSYPSSGYYFLLWGGVCMVNKMRQIPDDMIERLKQNIYVESVNEHFVVLKLSMHQELYYHWKGERKIGCIWEMLAERNIGPEILGDSYLDALDWDFRTNGDPMKKGWGSEGEKLPEERRNRILLLSTGLFYHTGRIFKWMPDFKRAIQEQYPEVSVEESLRQAGIDPELVGKRRIMNLKNSFNKKLEVHEQVQMNNTGKILNKVNGARTGIERYVDHPYVQKVSGKGTIKLKDCFYNEAFSLKDLPLNKVLEIFEIDGSLLVSVCRSEIRTWLHRWTPGGKTIDRWDVQVLRIQAARLEALTEIAEEGFDKIRRKIPALTPLQKKEICLQISSFPSKRDHGVGMNIREILQKVGISKSTYYEALYKCNYGMATEYRMQQDARDLEKILYVMDYKGFEKGIRQIYMMLPELCGVKFAMSRIRRLLRGAGIRSGVRAPNPAKRRMGRFLERNRKPNLLKREFRLHMPNEIRLTDVTYLDYGCGDKQKRAYGSSCIDPVTGKLLVFHLSESNDLKLALDTLYKLSEVPSAEGALLHSDQGIVYFTDEFQEELAGMGMVQSMSKRGNCWDNAPQESFFGHFKDECPYEGCEDIDDLREMIDGYAWYYNHERHQWDRKMMTPVQFEEYLLSLDQEGIAEYMRSEQEKYDKMKARAEKKAVERAKSLGV